MYTGPHLGHDGRPLRATPTRIAASLAQGIIHGTNILRRRLREQAFPSTDPKRFNSEECLLECVLFECFLRDLVISVEFGRHRPTICRALVEHLCLDLERSGLSPEWLLQLERLHLSRFEYPHAFEAASSLQALGAAAWLRIVGASEPSDRMTMLLAVRAAAKLRALHGLATRYTVIGPTTARLRPPDEQNRDDMNVESIQAPSARRTSALDDARPSPGSSRAMLSPRLAVIAQT